MSSHALTTDTVSGLAETLRQCRLLSSSQQESLQALRGRFDNPRALASELVERGWLTAYQVKQLFLGRGGELLLDPYIVMERLGEGAAGQVFKARHQHMQRIAALKVIRKELLSDAEVLQRFYREIQVTSQISHANVVHAYDAGPIGANHMMVMEYVEGTDLHRRVKDSGPLPAALACDYVRQTALGLQYIHECGLVHRDLKPSNLLVTPDGQVKILDLGLARLQPGNGRQTGNPLTQIGAGMMGTPDYLAPEQAISLSNVDIRADIYSLGCTFFFLLTGQPPFAAGTMAQKLMRHQQAPVPSVRQLQPKLPKELDRILGRMLAKKPDQRYPTPDALAQDLAAVLRNRSLRVGKAAPPLRSSDKRSPSASSARPAGNTGRPRLPGRRKIQLALAALLLAVGLVGGLLLLPGQRPSSRTEAQAGVGSAIQASVGPATSRPTSQKRPADQRGELVAVWGEARGRHWGPVNCVTFATDGKQLASGGNDRVVRIWDAASRGELAVLGEGPGAVSLVAYSPDGRMLAACSRESNERPAELRAWDAGTFKLVRSIPFARGENIVGMHFAPDGQTIFTLGSRLENRQPGAQIKFYDPHTGQEKKPPVSVPGNFLAMRLSTDGKMLATANQNQCTVWSGDNFQKLSSFPAPDGATVSALAFAPDGQTLAAVVFRGALAPEVRLLDPATGKEKLTMPVGLASLTALEWSPDNRLLAVAGPREAGRLESEVQVLDASNGQKRAIFPVQGLPVTDMAFAPDSKTTLATCGQDHNVRLWDLATVKERAPNEAGHRVAVSHVSFTADDRSLVSVGANGDPTVRIWDVATGREQSSLNLAASAKGWPNTHVVLANDQQLLIWAPQGVKYFDIGAGRERDILSSPTKEVRGAAISPDGKSVAVAFTKNVRLWDATSGQERPLSVSLTQFANLLFSPDGKTLAIVEVRPQLPSGAVHLWDLATDRERTATATVADRVLGLTFAADGQTLAISHGNGEIRRWDVAGGKDLGALPGTLQPRSMLLAAPKGPALAAWDAQTLRVWNATTGRERFNVAGAWTGRGVAFSRDGQKLAAAASDNRVFVWNAISGNKLFEWKAPGPVLSMVFSGDGQRLATGNSNGTIGILHVP
jgi:WD40 repeat protein/serine/threonine protein kinase